jgi:hypothetical protein
LEEEERWWQKSRAIWITSGDKNTKFFHRFTSFRRNKKHIWEIEDEAGKLHSDKEAIKDEAINYFKSFYQDTRTNNIGDQVSTVRLFPRMVLEEEVLNLENPCSREEILKVLKVFSKDKCLGSDGWTVEFFLHFFELVEQDLLDVVEESRIRGEVIKQINSTFIALIPKVNRPSTFNDFRPIAMCNLCYNIIAKIIAKKIHLILSHALSEEKLGFLKGRQILDSIGMTQKCLHNIK